MSMRASTPDTGLSRADEAQLRQVVGSIAAGFGHEYFAKASAAGNKASELWDASPTAGSSARTSRKSSVAAAWA